MKGINRMKKYIQRDEEAYEFNARGEKYYLEGDYKKAIENFELAIGKNPEIPLLYLNMGMVYYNLKDLEQAIEYSKKAIEIAETDLFTDNKKVIAASYYYLGKIYEKQEEWREALRNYSLALFTYEDPVYRDKVREIQRMKGKGYEEVYFSDNILRNIIISIIDNGFWAFQPNIEKSWGMIIKEDIERIEEVSYIWHYRHFPGKINSLEGIQYMENLKILRIEGCNIKDLSPLANLSSLELISFRDNKINDITSIKNLKNLKVLDLSRNEIEDLSPLVGLPLEHFNIANNQIENLEPLIKLSDLKKVNLRKNRLDKTKAMEIIKKLEERGVEVIY